MIIKSGGLKYEVVIQPALQRALAHPVWIEDGELWRGIKMEDGATELHWIESDQPGILTNLLLIPTLEKWGEAVRQDTFDALFPQWKRYQRVFRQLSDEIEDNCLTWGEINRAAVDQYMLRALARFIFLQSGGATLGALRSFGGDEGYAWLFKPAETSHLSPFAANARAQRAAFGEVRIIWGEWIPRPLPQSEMGAAALRATQRGIPAVIEQLGKFAIQLGWIKDGKVSAPFAAGAEGEKAIKRLKLALANSATPTDKHISPLSIDSIATTDGVMIENVLVYKGEGGALGGPGDGGMLVHKHFMVDVTETRTVTSQLPEGCNPINPGYVLKGESLIGVPGILPSQYNCTVKELQVFDDGGVDTIRVKTEINVKSRAPKIRTLGIKASAHTDMASVLPINTNVGIVENILDAKSAELVVKQAYLLDTNQTFNVCEATPDFDLSMSKDYELWKSAHTVSVTITWPVSSEVRMVMEAAGMKFTNGLATRTITGILCPAIIAEVESPVTELRVTNTSLTMLTALEAEEVLGGKFQPVRIGVEPVPETILTTEDTHQALSFEFQQALEYLSLRYPKGFLIRNGVANDSVQNVSVAIDPSAVLSFSSGVLQADDPMGLLLWRALHLKATFATLNATGSEVEIAQARSMLGQTLNGLRAAVNNLAVSKAILRRLSTGARAFGMATARTYDYVPVNEIWMSSDTAEDLKLQAGVTAIVFRHPLPLFYTPTVRIKKLSYGVVGLSSLAMQMTNKGDADGDQIGVGRAGKVPTLYSSTNRSTVSKLISMMAWNAGIEIKPTKAHSFVPYRTRGALPRTLWHRSIENYTRHNGLADTQFAKTISPVDTTPKPDCGFDTYIDPLIYPQMTQFGSIGIGIAYGILHNSYVMHRYTGLEVFRQAFEVGQDIYEDVFLAGFTPERYKVFECLKDPVRFNQLGATLEQLRSALAEVGIQATAQILVAILIARNISAAFHGRAWVGDFQEYVVVCKAIRGLSSGNKDLIVSPTQWERVVKMTAFDNPFREIVWSNEMIYEVLARVHARTFDTES